MATEGPNYAGAATQTSTLKIIWTNPGNATGAPDGSAATASGAGDTEWLILTTYGFAVPDGATITDVAVTVTAKDTAGAAPIFLAQLVKGGVGVGDEQDLGGITSSYSDVTASGVIGAGYWNTSLSVAEANASDFGARVRFEGIPGGDVVSVDAAGITITYTGGGPAEGTRRIKLRKVG